MVVNCYSCGAWLGRLPPYYGSGDKGDYCHKCGGTAVKTREGRPFGRRHRDWEWMLKECEELIATFAEYGPEDPAVSEMEDAVVRR